MKIEGLEPERAVGHLDELLEQGGDCVSPAVVARVVLVTGLVPDDVGRQQLSYRHPDDARERHRSH